MKLQILEEVVNCSCLSFQKIWLIRDKIDEENGKDIAEIIIIFYNSLHQMMKHDAKYDTNKNDKVLIGMAASITKCYGITIITINKTESDQKLEEFQVSKKGYLKYVKRTKKIMENIQNNKDEKLKSVFWSIIADFYEIIIKTNIKQSIDNDNNDQFDLELSLKELSEFINKKECDMISLSFHFGTIIHNFCYKIYKKHQSQKLEVQLLCYSYSLNLIKISIENKTEQSTILCQAHSQISLKIASILNQKQNYKESLKVILESLNEIKMIDPQFLDISDLLRMKAMIYLNDKEINDDERSKIIFELLGNDQIKLQDGIKIIDGLKCSNYIEMMIDALNKLFCRFPSSIYILSRKLQFDDNPNNKIITIQQITKHCSKWDDIEKYEISKIIYNISANYYINGQYEISDKIFKQSCEMIMKLPSKKIGTKCNWLRARIVNLCKLKKYQNAVDVLHRVQKMDNKSIKNLLLELQIYLFGYHDNNKSMELIKCIESHSKFEPQFYAILANQIMNDTNDDSIKCLLSHIHILEKLIISNNINSMLRNNSLSLKYLIYKLKQYLNQQNIISTERQQFTEKLKKYLKLSLKILPQTLTQNIDNLNVDDISYFIKNVWDFSLQDGTSEMFDFTYDLIKRYNSINKYQNIQYLCFIFSSVIKIEKIWITTDDTKQISKSILISMEKIENEKNENTESPFESIMFLLKLKCYLILNQHQNIIKLLEKDCNKINGIDICYFETMLAFMKNFKSIDLEKRKIYNVLIIENVLNHIDIDEKNKNDNVTCDILCDYVRFIRRYISYQITQNNDKQSISKYRKYINSVIDEIKKFNDKNNNEITNSQELLLEDELKWFMAKCWNFAVYLCMNSKHDNDEQYIHVLEEVKLWMEMAVKISTNVVEVDELKNGMKAALTALEQKISNN